MKHWEELLAGVASPLVARQQKPTRRWLLQNADYNAGHVPMRPAASLKPRPMAPPKPEMPATALRLAPLWRGW